MRQFWTSGDQHRLTDLASIRLCVPKQCGMLVATAAGMGFLKGSAFQMFAQVFLDARTVFTLRTPHPSSLGRSALATKQQHC